MRVSGLVSCLEGQLSPWVLDRRMVLDSSGAFLFLFFSLGTLFNWAYPSSLDFLHCCICASFLHRSHSYPCIAISFVFLLWSTCTMYHLAWLILSTGHKLPSSDRPRSVLLHPQPYCTCLVYFILHIGTFIVASRMHIHYILSFLWNHAPSSPFDPSSSGEWRGAYPLLAAPALGHRSIPPSLA